LLPNKPSTKSFIKDKEESAIDQAICSKLVFIILSITILSNGAYSIVGPFMPLEFMRKGLSEMVTGYVFAIYSAAVVIGSPFMGVFIGKLGRRKTIICGLVLMGTAFIAFGAISYIENKTLFVIAALLARLT